MIFVALSVAPSICPTDRKMTPFPPRCGSLGEVPAWIHRMKVQIICHSGALFYNESNVALLDVS
jgi:hypothetical protein